MNSRAKQGFVHVDVPESSDDGLIEQTCFDFGRAPSQQRCQPRARKGRVKWFNSEAVIERSRGVCVQVQDAAKLPLVTETEVGSVVEFDGQMFETNRRGGAIGEDEATGHKQVNHQTRAVVEGEEKILAASMNRDDPPPD